MFKWVAVPSRREAKPSPPFLLNSVDRLGRPISPAVLSVAQEYAPQALSYAEKFLGDPAVALNLFEEAAAAVSEAVKTKELSGQASIRDLRAYLSQTFLHRMSQERRKEVELSRGAKRFEEWNRATREATDPETALLLGEVIAAYDKVTQEIVLSRMEGFSWEEIGARHGISAHAARIRFSKALQRARKMLKGRGRGG